MELVDYVQKNNKKHVIFDFDATIFLLVLPWSNWHQSIKQHLYDMDAGIWDAFERGDIRINEVQRQYIANHGAAARDFLNTHAASFEVKNLAEYHENTNMTDAIKKLNEMGVSTYLWTSNARPVIEIVLSETGFDGYFKKIITRQDVDNLKPSPDGFNRIFNADNHQKEEYLMVGDSSHDKGAAEAAGIDFYLTDFFNLGR